MICQHAISVYELFLLEFEQEYYRRYKPKWIAVLTRIAKGTVYLIAWLY